MSKDFVMQEESQIQLGSDEEILAEGQKNQVMYICFTLLLVVFIFFSLYEAVIAKTLAMGASFSLIAFVLPFVVINLSNSYKYNQIYLTDKRIVITQKDCIEGIPYDEVKNFVGSNTIYLKSNRKIFFAYTDLDDLILQFKEIYPSFTQKLFTIKDIIIIIVVLIFGLSLKFLPLLNKTFHKYNKTPSNYEELILNKDYYMLYLQKKLKSNWRPPKLAYNTKVTVEFQVLQDGTIINEKIIESSGNRDFDNAAILALKKSIPLRSLPEDLKQEKEVIINFTFDYNVKK